MIKQQRGIADGWLYLIVLAVVVGLIWYGCGELVQHGRDLQDAVWLKRENQKLADAQVKYKELDDKYRALERNWVEHDAQVSAQYEKEKAGELAKKDRTISDLRAGTLKLRIPVTACNGTGRGLVPPPGATPSQRDGGTSAELSGPAAEFLISFASEADTIVRQLASCQALVKKDRGG